ncbi:hypothetical protein [Pseudoclavibacter helvolus]|uniref:hypothetical protein n=1 Tax=Pseudoclavibacter helvolus TaxID=255205 RepID=UPI0008384335|nr:hypothetical protein [Pseudoclavibacter helvolus]
MPDQNADRRAELIAAALVGELTEAEAAEFERMRASDPTIDAELVQLQGLTGNISGLPDWMEASPSEELRERVLGIAAADRGGVGRLELELELEPELEHRERMSRERTNRKRTSRERTRPELQMRAPWGHLLGPGHRKPHVAGARLAPTP